MAEVHAGMGPARSPRGRRSRWPEEDPNDVLLQPELPPIRRNMGRPVQADRSVLGARAVPTRDRIGGAGDRALHHAGADSAGSDEQQRQWAANPGTGADTNEEARPE